MHKIAYKKPKSEINAIYDIDIPTHGTTFNRHLIGKEE